MGAACSSAVPARWAEAVRKLPCPSANPLSPTACAAPPLALALLCCAFGSVQAAELRLHYTQPAEDSARGWEQQALPIGNGRLGGMIFGQPAREHLQFNEITLWSGDAQTLGAYQPFGDVWVELSGHERPVQDYRRELDLTTARQRMSYTLDGVHYEREAFASHPAQVIVLHFSASAPGRLSGRLRLADMHGAHLAARLLPSGARLYATGSLAGWVLPQSDGSAADAAPSRNRLSYASQLQRCVTRAVMCASTGQSLVFEHCDGLTLLLAAGTSYVADATREFQGEHPLPRVTSQLDAAASRPLQTLRDEQLRDHSALFSRVDLNLGRSSADRRTLPTDQRLARYNARRPGPRAGGTVLPVRPLPADRQLARQLAGQFARTVEQQPASAVERGLPHQH